MNKESLNPLEEDGFVLLDRNNANLKQTVYSLGVTKPAGVKRFYNYVTQYYVDWCIERIISRFRFKGFPEAWDYDYLASTLLLDGRIAIFNVNKYGNVAMSCSFEGQNMWYRPTNAVISNPILGSYILPIDEKCVIVKLKSNYTGLNTLVMKYAYQLAQCDSSIDVNLWNSKVTMIYRAKDNKEAKEMKLINQKVSEGQPAVYTTSDVINGESVTYLPAKQNYVADLIQDTKRTIVCEFLSELGINNSPIDKKERVTNAEVSSNNQDMELLVNGYVNRMNQEFKKANKMFGLNLSVELANVDGGEIDVQPAIVPGMGPATI